MNGKLTMTRDLLNQKLLALRAQLERGFSPETAQFGQQGSRPGTGQCAAVTLIVRDIFGGEMVSARVQDESHWFNRLCVDEGVVDVDLTADQFSETAVRVCQAGDLYPDTRIRRDSEVAEETRRRSTLLRQRAEIDLDAI